MKIPLLSERFSIETELTPRDVVQRLRLVTGPARLIRGPDDSRKEFYGYVDDREFRVTRRIDYLNSFNPLIRGTIEETPTGSSVQVSLAMRRWVSVFMGLWFGFLALFFVAAVAIVATQRTSTVLVFLPLVLAVFGRALTTFAFKVETRRNRERLADVLSAEKMPGSPPRYRMPGSFEIGWSDVRAAGPLALVWEGCFAVGAVLGLYDWWVRPAGCTNLQANDPMYSCPSDAQVFSVWVLFASVILTTSIGIWPIRRRRTGLLIPIILAQIAAILALAWIAHDPTFQAHRR
jgi:hypothetical protein